jgi:Lactate racemase N-terminal domain
MSIQMPKLIEVRQAYPASPRLEFQKLLAEQFDEEGLNKKILPGMRVAVGVGSRGISNLKEIVEAAIRLLMAAGAQPFLIPAMGSHGGATPEGQTKVLAEYGITAESLGVAIDADMEVKKIGTAPGGREVVFSAAALRADWVVVINRIKPHTDFRGPLGSGIQKMLTIGFGKQIGAANAHRAAAHVGHEAAIREFARVVLDNVPVLCGIAILEDQHHNTSEIGVLRPEVIVSEEQVLLERARLLMPRLPLDEIDLLIVDQIGKEISGTGMDTNIIGRDITGYSTSLQQSNGTRPHVARIFVRDLSHATNGNGIGIGLADFTTDRLVTNLDLPSMFINATTSIGLNGAKIPIHFPSDREAIHEALASLAPSDPESIRIVRIADTLRLERMLVSECCSDTVGSWPGVTIVGQAHPMQFDQAGNLLPL